jgi:hypothetical protein
MPITRITPPLEYLQAASRASLQSFELSRLNHAANLRQEIAALIDQWIQETSEAMLARWMLDHHQAPQSTTRPSPDAVRTLAESSATLFADGHLPISEISPAPPRFVPARTPLKTSLSRKSQKSGQSATG